MNALPRTPLTRGVGHYFPVSWLAVCCLCLCLFTASPAGAFRFGINADNWSGQISHAAFEDAAVAMGVEFIVWHISPYEEDNPQYLMQIVDFCRKLGIGYAFNTEVVNYLPDYGPFRQADGTFRWDLKPETMELLADDPLFLGVVYDEPMLMQELNGTEMSSDYVVSPYFAQTKSRSILAARNLVVDKIHELALYYGSYGKRLIFEMVFPDYAHTAARAGALLAPKFLKENYNDLMFAVFGSAAHQYGQAELWGCIDLWFLDRFPENGYYTTGYHTPQELYETLVYVYEQGVDYAYIENAKGLMDESFTLTDFGKKVVEFQAVRSGLTAGDWRRPSVDYILSRLPDGYWGQAYSLFVPDHPYGSWRKSGNDDTRHQYYLYALHKLSAGAIPQEANNWNAVYLPYYAATSYEMMSGLLPTYFVDEQFPLPEASQAGISGIDIDSDITVLKVPLPLQNDATPAIRNLLLTP